MKAKATYNFVPLSKQVRLLSKEADISHDMPYADGLSGSIAYVMTTHAPLLVGGVHQPRSDDKLAKVSPCVDPSGRYYVPGSSLKGMIRGVLEIASHARMQAIDDRRFSLRDITSTKVSKDYVDRIGTGSSKIKAGWIRRAGNGVEFRECRFTHIHHAMLSDWLGLNARSPFIAGQGQGYPLSVAKKYEIVRSRLAAQGHQADKLTAPSILFAGVAREEDPKRRNTTVTALGGRQDGRLVLTGQINDPTRPNSKRREFVFFDEEGATVSWTALHQEEWRGFLDVHDGDGEPAPEGAWGGYWKACFDAGGEVPVFWVGAAGRRRLGLAFMPRLAADFSTRDCAMKSSRDHVARSDAVAALAVDCPEALFGFISPISDQLGLRGRVLFGTALAEQGVGTETTKPTILGSPKAGFFPNYLVQGDEDAASVAAYRTYVGEKAPELRGWKRYPVCGGKVQVQPIAPGQRDNRQVQVELEPVRAGAKFEGMIRFHNLRPWELGALLWALTWRDNPGLRHSLGMAKGFRFGQVSFQIRHEDSSIRAVKDDKPELVDPERIRGWMGAFEQFMVDDIPNWRKSASVRTLLAMADPAGECAHELAHPVLDPENRRDEFREIKRDGGVLPFWPKQAELQPYGDAGNGIDPHAPAFEAFFREQFSAQRNVREDDFRRGRVLADKVREETDPERRKAFARIVLAMWAERGWMEGLGKSAKVAKEIYDGILAAG